MSRTPGARVAGYDSFWIRCFFVAIGCFAAWWGIVEFSGQRFQLERVANRIIAGESFNSTVLDRQLSAAESIEKLINCRPAAIRSVAIIRLRIAEIAASSTSKNAGADLEPLDSAIRSSLSCAPADPFLWLVLYWVKNVRGGLKPEYLRMSYDLAPNEGWVALKRNAVALADFEKLPPDLAALAINEFLALINNGFYQQAVEILSGPAWPIRDKLLQHIASLPLRSREGIARIVYQKNLGIIIPGVEPPDSKPRWR